VVRGEIFYTTQVKLKLHGIITIACDNIMDYLNLLNEAIRMGTGWRRTSV